MKNIEAELVSSFATVALVILAVVIFIYYGGGALFYAVVVIAVVVGFFNAWLISRSAPNAQAREPAEKAAPARARRTKARRRAAAKA
jgi:preprotein translocase subunit SecF